MADVCPQCGFIHPPVAIGEKCPLSKDKDSSGQIIDASEFITQVRNIIVSKIQEKKIKNHKKLFSSMLVEVFKFLENYKE